MSASMELNLKESLCMATGDGEHSYLKASSYVQMVVAKTMPFIEKVANSLVSKHDISSSKVLNIADLGCSTGPNTFLMMSKVLETVTKKCNELKISIPEFQFYLNDLPNNDFNTLFKCLSDFHNETESRSFVSAVPGSFYDRLFPSKSLHFIHSSYALTWLSNLPKLTSEQYYPLNPGKIHISKTSPPIVEETYLSLFEQDFSLFLKCRLQEMVDDGVMLLTMQSRECENPAYCNNTSYPNETIARAIAELVSEGLTDREKLDGFNMPIYCPTVEEIRHVVKMEGGFVVEHLETMILEVEGGASLWPSPEDMAKGFRSYTEPVIAMQFGCGLMDRLYEKVARIIAADWEQGFTMTKGIFIVAMLSKN